MTTYLLVFLTLLSIDTLSHRAYSQSPVQTCPSIEPPPVSPPISTHDRQALLETFAPYVRFHPSEDTYPSSIEWFLERSEFRYKTEENWSGPTELIKRSPAVADFQTTHTLSVPESQTFVSPFGNAEERETTFSGEPITEGLSPAPVYANLIEKPDGAVIQYLFFYPFNGILFNFLKCFEGLIDCNFGKHEGDWEHIDVHLEKSDNQYHLSEVFYAAHGASWFGGFYKASEIEKIDQTHPVVYSAFHTHASYPSPWFLNYLGDQTSAAGAAWKTWQKVINVGSVEHPTPGNEWIQFKGRWGFDGIETPSNQDWWRKSTPQYFPLIQITFNPSSGKGALFSLRNKVPPRFKKLYWKIDHPLASKISFSVSQRSILGQITPYLKNINGQGSVTKIPYWKSRLFLSQIQVPEELKSLPEVKVSLYGMED